MSLEIALNFLASQPPNTRSPMHKYLKEIKNFEHIPEEMKKIVICFRRKLYNKKSPMKAYRRQRTHIRE